MPATEPVDRAKQGMRVAVLAATPFDTQLGCDMLRERGVECDGFTLSQTPGEQANAQYFDAAELERRVLTVVQSLSVDRYGQLVLFCNSLSTAIDTAALERESPIPVISPRDIYSALPLAYASVFLLAANGQALAGIEKIIREVSPSVKIFGMCSMPLVEAIEALQPLYTIYETFKLNAIGQLATEYRADALVLACTHFTVLASRIEGDSTVPIIDTAAILVANVTRTNRTNDPT